MRNVRLWRALLGVEETVVEDVEFDEDGEEVVVHVRPGRALGVGAGCVGGVAVRAAWQPAPDRRVAPVEPT